MPVGEKKASRFARYQLSWEDQQHVNAGMKIPLTTFGGKRQRVTCKSLRNVNWAAFEDHIFELRVNDERLLLSASELMQALYSV